MKIGILAVQGAFAEHQAMLNRLGYESVLLRQKSDIKSIDGLILPGGESTVQGKLLHELGMHNSIRELILADIPTLATCAGLILLAQEISNDTHTYLATMPITVKRNAYGRQLASFRTYELFGTENPIGTDNPIGPDNSIGTENSIGPQKIPMTFIRAPYIETTASDVTTLAVVENHIVAAKYRKQIGLSFHPELDDDTTVHEMFLDLLH